MLEGHQGERNSLTFLHNFLVTTAADCVIAVVVLNTTESSGHKVGGAWVGRLGGTLGWDAWVGRLGGMPGWDAWVGRLGG